MTTNWAGSHKLCSFEVNVALPFEQFLKRIKTDGTLKASERVASIREMTSHLETSWMGLKQLAESELSTEATSPETDKLLEVWVRSVQRLLVKTASIVEGLVKESRNVSLQLSCPTLVEAASGSKAMIHGLDAGEYPELFCDPSRTSEAAALIQLSEFHGSNIRPKMMASSLIPDNECTQVDSSCVREAKVAAFRKSNASLHAHFHRTPPSPTSVPYQVPWYIVNNRCAVVPVDHAGEGAKRGFPPPPMVPPGPDASSHVPTVVTVPPHSRMPRIDVLGAEALESSLASAETARILQLTPQERVKALAVKARARRAAMEAPAHLNLSAHQRRHVEGGSKKKMNNNRMRAKNENAPKGGKVVRRPMQFS